MIDAYSEIEKDILDDPAYVILNDTKIVFQDYGVGISKYRMDNVMSKFLASTKEKDPNAIGHFGLGSKAPFAYTNQYTIESVYNGVKRTWLFLKDQTKFDYSLLLEEDTLDRNQTRVIIPITDVIPWLTEIKTTLSCFRGVIFQHDLRGYYYQNLAQNIENFLNQPLVETDSFFYKKDINNCIALDQVLYPLPSEIVSTTFPFILKFGLDEGLTPVPSRESIIINETSIAVIKKRLSECLEELKKYTVPFETLHSCIIRDKVEFKFTDEISVYLSKAHVTLLYNSVGIKLNYIPEVFLPIQNIQPYEYYRLAGFEGYSIDSQVTRNYVGIDSLFFYVDYSLNSSIKKFLRSEYQGCNLIVKRKIDKKQLLSTLQGKIVNFSTSELESCTDAFVEEVEGFFSSDRYIPKSEYLEWNKRQVKVTNVDIFYRIYRVCSSGWRYKNTKSKLDIILPHQTYVYFTDIDSSYIEQLFSWNLDWVVPIWVSEKNVNKITQKNIMSFENFLLSDAFQKFEFRRRQNSILNSTYYTIRNSYCNHSKWYQQVIQSLNVPSSRTGYVELNEKYTNLLSITQKYCDDLLSRTTHLRPETNIKHTILVNNRLKKYQKHETGV